MKLLVFLDRLSIYVPAAFGRLRVETLIIILFIIMVWPAAFGRLRVETAKASRFAPLPQPSRLRAAAC